MAEDEIIKHSKKVYHIFKSEGKSLKNKALDIFVEILIIIFAVSTSIWLHNWSERRHDKKEELEFLTGLKEDLQKDLENMAGSKEFYEKSLLGTQYFLKVGIHDSLARDSMNEYSYIFFSSSSLDPHLGRYEGLKSSGKFKIIDNKNLLNDLIDLHESIFQRIQDLNDKYYRHNEKFEMLIAQNVKFNKQNKISNANYLIHRNDFKILLTLSSGIISNNILPVHEKGIQKCKKIIQQIDIELNQK